MASCATPALRPMMSSPKAVFINGRFLSQPITGAQRYAREAVLALDSLMSEPIIDPVEWEVTLLSPPGTRTSLPLKHIRQRLTGRFSGHLWEQLDLPLASRGGVLLNLCNTAPLAKRLQVVTLHDAAVLRAPQDFTWAFRSWYRVLWNGLARSRSTLLTVSAFSRSELCICLGLSESRIRTVPESGEHILAVAPDPRILERHALRAKPYVLAVSTANPRKNFAAVARAIELVGDAGFDFVVAGGVDPRVFSGAGVPLPAFVKRVGYVTDAELRALYEHAACFVYPSLYEGFGLPPLEAMACGCAVIVSDAASLPEICGDAAIYCDPRSPEDIAGKLAALMADGERRRNSPNAGTGMPRNSPGDAPR